MPLFRSSEFAGKSRAGADPVKAHEPPPLYKVDVDPGEKFEIGAKHPDVVTEIQRLAAEHRAAVTPVPSRLVERVPSTATR